MRLRANVQGSTEDLNVTRVLNLKHSSARYFAAFADTTGDLRRMPMHHQITKYSAPILVGAALVSLPTSTQAQDVRGTTPEAFLEMLEAFSDATQKPRFAVIQGVASAATLPNGTAFASVSGTDRRDGTGGIDGSLAFGVGFGDARKTIGVQIVTSITSADPNDFGDSGSFSVKFSRVLPDALGSGTVGITIDNLSPWGDVVGEKVKTSIAWTSARQFTLANGGRLPVLFNLGVASETDRRDSWTPFAAVGLGVSENLSITVAHNGDYAIIGASARLPWVENLSVSASLLDAFDQRDEQRMTLTVSYAFNDLF